MSNLYTGDIEVIRKELELFEEKLVRAKNISEQYMCIAQMFGLNDYHKSMTGKDYINFNKMAGSNKYRFQQVTSFGYKHQDKLNDKFILNKEKILTDSSSALELMAKNDSVFDDVVIVERFDEKLAMEIIFDFLKKYHPEDVPYLKKLIEEKRLISIKEFDESEYYLRGHCSYLYKSLPLILVQSPMYTIETISFLIHEFGHAIDMKDLDSMYSSNQIQKMFFSSSEDEVVSKLYERQVLEFFMKEGINSGLAADLLADYYAVVMESLREVQFFSYLPDWLLNKSEYLKYRGEEMIDFIENDEMRDKFISSQLDFENLDIFSSIRYSVGGLNAFLLHSRLENDQVSGQKDFRYFMGNRVKIFDGSLISCPNVSLYELEKVLNNECETIQKYKK